MYEFYYANRLLQISSFNGKMNALNEVNKVITNVTYYPHRHGQLEEEEWLTAEKMAVSVIVLKNLILQCFNGSDVGEWICSRVL